ncbi:hypothetical protein TeGR_g2719, partial [Tetraparma gracilis]
MTLSGSQIRPAVAGVIVFAFPPSLLSLVHHFDQRQETADLLMCALLVIAGGVVAKLLTGRGEGKGINVMYIAIPLAAAGFRMTLNTENSATAVVPTASSLNLTNSTGPVLELLPLPSPPSIPADSTCQWHYADEQWPIGLPANSTSPDFDLLPDSTLRSSKCKATFEEADWDKIIGAIGNLGAVATVAGVTESQWDEEVCIGKILNMTLRAMTPYCSSTCSPLGFCESDCHSAVESCGRFATKFVLKDVMKGGQNYFVVEAMLGVDLASCVDDMFNYVTNNNYDSSKICTSPRSGFSHMSFGSTPNVDCLLIEDDPNAVLRDPLANGECALARWDAYKEEFASVTEANEAITANMTHAANLTSTSDDASKKEEGSRFPPWRDPAIVLIPALMFMLLWVGDRLAVKKKKTTGPENLAAVTPVLDSAPTAPPPASKSKLAEELNFIDFFGFTGVFVSVALLAAGGLTLFLGYEVENSDIEGTKIIQAACFYAIAVLAVVYWFTSVMLWREVVNNLVDVEEGRVDPLAALDKIPAAKNLMKWYHDRFAIHTGGRYSLVVVISAELFELVVQATNANTLAKYLDWSVMQLYGNVIFVNFLLFGICLMAPERLISSSTMITVDVVIG